VLAGTRMFPFWIEGFYWSKGDGDGGVVVTTGAIRRAKFQS